MEEKIICRVLTGPTASGKSELGMRLAERNGWEICCMDSMQVYRGMDIGTAKPTAEDRARIRHHLLDLCDPTEHFSVAAYKEMAEKLIREKWQRERRELLFVGGTGLYLQALAHPMALGGTPADEKLREELHRVAEEPEGKERLHRMLRELDPVTAERLSVNDLRRVIRAIEVSRETGIPFSRHSGQQQESPFLWRVAAADLPREMLYRRINRRVLEMVEHGLADEVRRLLDAGVSPGAQSMQALGYKEMVRYLEGACSLDQAIEEIQKGTRHYAKRQGTFLRRDPSIQYIPSQSPEAISKLERVFAGEVLPEEERREAWTKPKK